MNRDMPVAAAISCERFRRGESVLWEIGTHELIEYALDQREARENGGFTRASRLRQGRNGPDVSSRQS